MKSRTRAFRDARKLGNVTRIAGTNGRKSRELAVAASHVVAKRMTLGAAAMIDPRNADHVEFAKIIPEKTTAFSNAGMALLQGSSEAAVRMANFTTSELATAAKAAVEIASCRTPAGVIAAQSRFATAWFARVLSQSIVLASLAMRSQGTAMAPIYRAATANARRLSR
ncbi:MAG TPA: phasin family protein [Stellaceae bacterium]|nr:phasin family protein [Stellaceae bacterium]